MNMICNTEVFWQKMLC